MGAGKITTTTAPLATDHGPNEPYSHIQNENKILVALLVLLLLLGIPKAYVCKTPLRHKNNRSNFVHEL